jgi:hypothetical protein
VTTSGPDSQSNSSYFCCLLTNHDTSCVVTRGHPFIASHLIPRCLGSDGVRGVMEHFVGPAGANGIGVYDAQIGVALCSNLDHWVDTFQAGFYHVTVSYLMCLFIVTQLPTLHRTIPISSTISSGMSLICLSLARVCKHSQNSMQSSLDFMASLSHSLSRLEEMNHCTHQVSSIGTICNVSSVVLELTSTGHP